jgi:hypothetical protein
MIHIERTRKTSNVPEPSREENIYVIKHNIRTKEDIDGIYDVATMT